MPEWKESQLLAFEKESVGFYLSGHPLAAFQADIARYATATTETLDTVPDGKEVTICGIIAGMKIKVTKKSQEKMAILNLEDLSGTVEVVVFPDLYKTSQHLLLTDTPLIVAGQLDKNEQENKIKAVRLHLLTEVKKRGTTRMDIRFNATGLTQDDLIKVKEILLQVPGLHPGLSPAPEPFPPGLPDLRGPRDPCEPQRTADQRDRSPCWATASCRWVMNGYRVSRSTRLHGPSSRP